MAWLSLAEQPNPDPQARIVWSFVGRLDFDRWLKDIKAIEHHGG